MNTVSAKIDLDAYLGLLKVNGVLVNVGAPAEPLSLSVGNLLGKRRSFAGSATGGIVETQEMLDFCAANNIVSDIEIIDIKYIQTAYDRMIKGDVRYRFVIDIATL